MLSFSSRNPSSGWQSASFREASSSRPRLLSLPKLALGFTYHLDYSIFEVVMQQFGCHREYGFNIFACLGRRLEEKGYVVFALELLCLLGRHFSELLSVFLVADKDHDHLRFALRYYLGEPVLQIYKGVHSSYVVR